MRPKIKVLGILFAVLLLTIFFSGCFGDKQPNISITDLYSIKAEYEGGKTLFMNITFENNGEETAWISNPLIITDGGRELYCDFIKADEEIDEFSSGGLQIPSNKIVHVTIKTWDKENFSYCLLSNEKPAYFKYSYGSGIMFAPSGYKVRIPDDLINNI